MSTVVKVRKLSDEYTETDVGGGVLRCAARQRWHVEADGLISIPDAMESTVSGDDGPLPAARAAYSATRPDTRVQHREGRKLTARLIEFDIAFVDPELATFETEADLLALPAEVTELDQVELEQYVTDESEPPKNLTTTAGEPFDRFPERDSGLTIITVKKYVTAETRAEIRNARRTQNGSPKTIDGYTYDAANLMLSSASFERVKLAPVNQVPGGVTTGRAICRATITIKFKPNGWIDKALNYGFNELVNGQRRKIMEDMLVKEAQGETPATYEKTPVTQPWPLNTDGSKMANSTDVPLELRFFPYRLHSWSGVPVA